VNVKYSASLRLMSHQLRGHMCLILQCSACAEVIDAGFYTLENDSVILGEVGEHVCEHCGASIQRPLLFETAQKARQFLDSINVSVEGVRARLIPKRSLELAYIDVQVLRRASQLRICH
jgi:hypothetical protein